MEVVPFVDDFFRPRARLGDSLRPGRPCSCEKACSRSDEIDRTSSEMERVRDATHAVIALSSPATASHTKVGMDVEQDSKVKCCMSSEPPDIGQHHRVRMSRRRRSRHYGTMVRLVRDVGATPRRRCVSKASSTWTMLTSRKTASARDHTDHR